MASVSKETPQLREARRIVARHRWCPDQDMVEAFAAALTERDQEIARLRAAAKGRD